MYMVRALSEQAHPRCSGAVPNKARCGLLGSVDYGCSLSQLKWSLIFHPHEQRECAFSLMLQQAVILTILSKNRNMAYVWPRQLRAAQRSYIHSTLTLEARRCDT